MSLERDLANLYAAAKAPPTATTPPPIATGTAHAGAVPMPTSARAGPAHPPIAAPAAANGTVAAMPTPPVARPTPEPKTPPATPPIAAPAALIAPVADAPAATIPAADAAEPPAIAAPIAMFSAFFVAGFFSSSCVGSDIVTSIWKKSALVGRHYFFHSPSFSGLGKEIVPFSLSRTQRRTEYEFP